MTAELQGLATIGGETGELKMTIDYTNFQEVTLPCLIKVVLCLNLMVLFVAQFITPTLWRGERSEASFKVV